MMYSPFETQTPKERSDLSGEISKLNYRVAITQLYFLIAPSLNPEKYIHLRTSQSTLLPCAGLPLRRTADFCVAGWADGKE